MPWDQKGEESRGERQWALEREGPARIMRGTCGRDRGRERGEAQKRERQRGLGSREGVRACGRVGAWAKEQRLEMRDGARTGDYPELEGQGSRGCQRDRITGWALLHAKLD